VAVVKEIDVAVVLHPGVPTVLVVDVAVMTVLFALHLDLLRTGVVCEATRKGPRRWLLHRTPPRG
jgi:hypothetical protein